MNLFDWRKKVDDHLEAERLEQEKTAKQEQEGGEKKRQEEEVRKAQEYTKRLKELQSRFRCHICSRPTAGPYIQEAHTWRDRDYEEFHSAKTNWNLPSDLKKCSKCQRWTCEEHLYKGICQHCAKKL